ncbi:hypothetical protein HYN59_08695 [Flavobacterium album]|uniref:DUF4843 domain-containing protein n=1 Tax=Flavobacterium album TaxID=2175091 RepID=A0A2S1QXT5_9FLAO|nr:hypothetical protein [Flavobacterium album]AWH85194.1 hypothetical protein HYN59_08695 [Flavobacterium album]
MKKYLSKIVVFALLVGVLSSCEEDKIVYKGDGQSLVGFNTAAGNLKTYDPQESTNPSEIIVEVGSTKKVNYDRTVQVVINDELTDALPSQYTIDQSTFVIPAGEFTAKIKITGHYDALTDIKQTLTLDLISVQDQDIFDAKRARYTVSIYRVCPRDIPLTYTGYVTGEVGGATEEFTVTFVPTADAATYNVANLWGNFVSGATGSNYDGQYPYPAKLVINCDNTVDITPDSNSQVATDGSDGTFDPDTNEFQLSLTQDLFSDPFTADIYLIPAP